MRTPTDKHILDEDADLYYDKTKKKEEEYQYQTPYTLYIDFLWTSFSPQGFTPFLRTEVSAIQVVVEALQ